VVNEFSDLLNLAHEARQEPSLDALAFMAVNDTHGLVPYRQAALWFKSGGTQALSGVVQVEANAPYVQWLGAVCQEMAKEGCVPTRVQAEELQPDLGGQWSEWLPSYGLFLPLADPLQDGGEVAGALFLARDQPWAEAEIKLLTEWAGIWMHAFSARHAGNPWSLKRLWEVVRQKRRFAPGLVWWKRQATWWAAGIFVLLACPVRLTVLAPAELTAAHPDVIRAPMDGVVARILVAPNARVESGQALFTFEDATLKSRLEVARQAFAGAQAEYRQASQWAVTDSKYKAQIAMLETKAQERQAEVRYVQDLLQRSQVSAPRAGIAIFDDPSEWIGKPVVTGERVMRIAAEGDTEVEAWLPVGDAIPLPQDAALRLYLNASPLDALDATVRYMAHDAQQRPDGTYAYRIRAVLRDPSSQRVGLKGTAKVSGGWVPVVYWVLRRPLAVLRQTLGW
jgi:hypothetical protein